MTRSTRRSPIRRRRIVDVLPHRLRDAGAVVAVSRYYDDSEDGEVPRSTRRWHPGQEHGASTYFGALFAFAAIT